MTLDPSRLAQRHRQIRRRRAAVVAAVVTTAVGLLILLSWLAGPDPATTPVAPASTPTPTTMTEDPEPVAAVDPDQAPAPGMDPQFAPPDGPHPDSPPFDVDAYAMRDELRTHGVDLPDDKLTALVDMADKYIAQDDMDLDAWDPRIMRDVRAMWPDLDRDHVIDVTRCTAEYIERVKARNAGLPHPPDEDDHNDTVDGRGPQPRVATPAGGEPTR
jgi:hypothetical protein